MPARRLPRLAPSSLGPEGRALYDQITGGPRAGSAFPLTGADGALEGPFNAMLLQPGLGEALQALGAAIRYATSLSVRATEIAVLTVARVRDCAFERYAHEAVARQAGFSETELAALRDGADLADPADRLVARIAAALAERGDLSDDEFAAARDTLGLVAVFELTTLVGYYSTLALQLRTFRVELP
jgi:4-carboxymuconolactone decarboxylase